MLWQINDTYCKTWSYNSDGGDKKHANKFLIYTKDRKGEASYKKIGKEKANIKSIDKINHIHKYIKRINIRHDKLFSKYSFVK